MKYLTLNQNRARLPVLRLPALMVLGIFIVLSGIGCGENERLLGSRADGLTKKEIQFVAWWTEDVAHGGMRSPDELVRKDSSPAMNRLAHWAYGRIYNNEGSGTPPVLRDRRQRWPLIAASLAQGTVILDDEGLPFLNTQDDATARLLATAVHEEAGRPINDIFAFFGHW